MNTFIVSKRIDAFLMEGKFENQDEEFVAVVWTGDNSYSVRTLANDIVEELDEKVPTGRLKINLSDFEIGDMIARPKDSIMVGYDWRVKYPDNSNSPLLHVKAPKVVLPK